MSNYWKKPEQHNINFNAPKIIKPEYHDLPFTQEYYIYEGQIMPNTMIRKKQAYEITQIHPILIINGFCICIENGRVQTIIVFGIHPNTNPDTNNFCLPDYKKNRLFDESYFYLIIKNIETYYLDNSYYQPPAKYVTYKKLKSIYLELHEGELND